MNNKWQIEAEIDFISFPHASELLNEKFKDSKRKWISRIRDARIPEWWKRAMKLDGGGIHKRKFYGGYKLYYTNSGKYDYMEVLEQGRPRYDMKPSLLRGGKMGKNGMYRVIPIRKGGVKFRVINALTSGWFYPEIPKTNAFKEIKSDIELYIESDEFKTAYIEDLKNGKSSIYAQKNQIDPLKEDLSLNYRIDEAIRKAFG